jgi:hypothetical protein
VKDYHKRKGFTRKPQGDEPATPGKNYITPSGLQRLKDEHRFLLTSERPAVTKMVAWAASNGDRSEKADYQYSKRRLRQIDGRIRFSHEANRCRGGGGPGKSGAGGRIACVYLPLVYCRAATLSIAW